MPISFFLSPQIVGVLVREYPDAFLAGYEELHPLVMAMIKPERPRAERQLAVRTVMVLETILSLADSVYRFASSTTLSRIPRRRATSSSISSCPSCSNTPRILTAFVLLLALLSLHGAHRLVGRASVKLALTVSVFAFSLVPRSSMP